jgi:hypothetical protein
MPKKTLVHLVVLAVMLTASVAVIGVALFWPRIDPLGWDFALLGAFLALVFLVRLFAKICSENWLEIRPMVIHAMAWIWLVASLLAVAASTVSIFVRRWKIFPDWVHNILMVIAIVSVLFSLLNFRKWPPD